MWCARAVEAAEQRFGSTYAAAGLTPDSGWDEILATPRIYLQFPMVPAGLTLVSPALLCAQADATVVVPARSPEDPVLVATAPPEPVVNVYRQPFGFTLNHAKGSARSPLTCSSTSS
ncbi:MAG: hypothetical protein ACREMB_09035 [Candidatus Rokuibacteriota bacterium]